MVVEQKAPVQKGLVKTRAEDRMVLEEPHVGEGPVGLIPKTDKKLQPFPVLLCDGGMADIGNTLYKASGIDPGAFSVPVHVGALPAQEKKGAIVLKNQIFVLGEMAGVVDKSTA